ncbi:class Ib ribonucleoside-diphosphate reductase assembly flavoprotein NrdI [Gottfriedia sp. S16(2024)]|uniref:class Ib ribonucleoside-diphosphate reductase assembly flavoprotein NrdI n=1 Tax=Gottfriedia sp. S16(2024) TaxID=3162883 RepID=UPI003D1B4396
MNSRIYFDSLTGNVRRFVERLPFEAVDIAEVEDVSEPFILVTYTTGFGNVPPSTSEFLRKHGDKLIGVASSGNIIWGENFGKAADRIALVYNVPILLKFELSGTNDDIKILTERVSEIWQNGRN